jgi:threonine dehydrogenase-like Zn-dependent dehydrogenase
MSDHAVIDENHAIKLPDSMPLDIGGMYVRWGSYDGTWSSLTPTALVEPLAVAWHAVGRSPLKAGDTALVVGAGPIGLAIVQVLKARGVETVIVVEISEQRRKFAQSFGASHVLNPREVDAVARVREITRQQQGVSVSFETSGVQAGLDTVMAGLRARGTAVIVSMWDEKPIINAFIDVVLGEKHVTGAAVYDEGDFEAVIEAITSGKSDPLPSVGYFQGKPCSENDKSFACLWFNLLLFLDFRQD